MEPNTKVTELPFFKHAPLDLSSTCIRLIDILPRDGRNEIRCNIRHVELTKVAALDYVALSYVWGDPHGPRHAIQINQGQYHVLHNLYNFLENNAEAGIQNLFVDAICIDQSNATEKNHQVRLMSTIYRGASMVLAWLGPSADHSDELFDFMNNLPMDQEWGHVRDLIKILRKDNATNFSVALAASAKICSRDYWSRAWILQEFYLAERLELSCGMKRVPHIRWKCLWRVFDCMIPPPFHITEQGLLQTIKHSHGGKFQGQWDLIKAERGDLSLTRLVLHFNHLQCRDPHDKFYAFLGLAEDIDQLPVNYEMPIAQLLATFLATRPPNCVDFAWGLGSISWSSQEQLIL
ncbi:hypothetical protein LTR93_008529 [Exophiala xenobiotica]|nr:hypothetical protein LTR93_008529 [Exophiala xenobiotica]KAK5410141.1 hypothetical protein LTR06_006607 [Exophiala xenobiotica]